MDAARSQRITVSVEHPAVWVDKGAQIVRDLVAVLTHPRITRPCLLHLIRSRDRLISGHYELPGHELLGTRGCFMNVLTEPLGPHQIRTKHDLTRFFGRARGFAGWPGYVAAKDSPEYQPAKWLVRLVDGQYCEQVRARYGRSCELFDYDLVIAVAQQVLTQREPIVLPPEQAVISDMTCLTISFRGDSCPVALWPIRSPTVIALMAGASVLPMSQFSPGNSPLISSG